jgi:hypothetical protein
MAEAINENMLLYHNSEFITQDGKRMNKKMTDVRNFYSGSDSRIFLFENCVSGHSMMFKKELVTKLGSFNSTVFHD